MTLRNRRAALVGVVVVIGFAAPAEGQDRQRGVIRLVNKLRPGYRCRLSGSVIKPAITVFGRTLVSAQIVRARPRRLAGLGARIRALLRPRYRCTRTGSLILAPVRTDRLTLPAQIWRPRHR